MAFGLSFGMNKGKTSTQKTSLSTEDLSQIQSQDTLGTQTGTESQTGQSASSSLGTSSTGTESATSNVGKTTQDTTSKSQLFGDDILTGLSSLAAKMLGADGKGDKAVGSGLDYLGNFDPDKFIAQNMASAKAESDMGLQDLVFGLTDKIGGRGNSMWHSANERARNEAAAKLAGVQANATQVANSIVGANTQLAQGVTDSGTSALNAILGQLKGGMQLNTGLQSTLSDTMQKLQQQGTTTTSEDSTQQTQQQSESFQQLSQMVTSLLDSLKTTNLSETAKGKTSSMGLGATA